MEFATSRSVKESSTNFAQAKKSESVGMCGCVDVSPPTNIPTPTIPNIRESINLRLRGRRVDTLVRGRRRGVRGPESENGEVMSHRPNGPMSQVALGGGWLPCW